MPGRYREDPIAAHVQAIQAQRQVLKHVDESLARERELLRRVRSEIAALLEHRLQVLAQIKQAREAITAERQRARDALVESVMARVDQQMTTAEIATALHLHPRRVDQLIAERRRSEAASGSSRRSRPLPKRRVLR